jgi:nitric oxide reductase large subunit
MTTHAHLTRRPRRGSRLLAMAAAISMTAVLAACSSDDAASDGSYGSSESGGAASEAAPAEDRGAAREPGPGGATGGAAQDTDAAGSSSTSSTTGRNRPPVAERHVISQGTVSLTSDDVREARRDVQRVVDAQGGDITEEQTDTDEDGAAVYARLVLRVPAARFGDAMTALEAVGDLRGSDRTSEDVSTQVIDTDVRVRAQEASLERVEQLLARAQGLKDIIWIESQLTTRQAELDSLKQQQAWLADQTRDSTIVVDISRTPEEEQAEEEEASGFLAGFSGGMAALGAVAVGLATIAGALLPFVVVLLLVGLPAWLIVRRTVRRRRTSATPPAAA